MRAVGATRFGGPEVLTMVELPEPHAGSGEVRIRVHAAAVNPADCSIHTGTSRAARMLSGRLPPYLPGMDAAGEIDEVGDRVTGVDVGDLVMAVVLPSRPAGGAYAQYLVVSTRSVTRIPEGTDLFRAATIPMNGLTAMRALDLLDLRAGQTLVVTGAAGALGGYTLQLAVNRGLRVIAVASESDREMLRKLGPHEFVLRGDGLVDRIRAIAPDGVDGAVDGAVLHERLIPAIRDGGGLAIVREWEGGPVRGISVYPVKVSDYSERTDLLDQLRFFVEDGVLTPCVAHVMPATQAGEAHRMLESGGIRGRMVLQF